VAKAENKIANYLKMISLLKRQKLIIINANEFTDNEIMAADPGLENYMPDIRKEN